MSLDDVFAQDMQAIAGREGGLGETLTFRPRGADPITVRGVVDRVGIVQDEESETAFEIVVVTLPFGGADVGLAAMPTPGDEIDVAFRIGETPARGRVRAIVSQDVGAVTFEVMR